MMDSLSLPAFDADRSSDGDYADPADSSPSSSPPLFAARPSLRVRHVRPPGARVRSPLRAKEHHHHHHHDSTLDLLSAELMRVFSEFLCRPASVVPVVFVLFLAAYLLLFDLRTHLILVCVFVGMMLIVACAVMTVAQAGGLLALLPASTQHLLLDYNLLELIKISWHSRTMQDCMSLIMFPLSRAERKRIIERLPARLGALLTRRGIVHLLPKPAKRIMGEGRAGIRIDEHKDGQSEVEMQAMMAASASQPNLQGIAVDDAAAISPSPSPRASATAPRGRSRSLSSLWQAEGEAAVAAEEADADQNEGRQAQRRSVRRRRVRSSAEECKESDAASDADDECIKQADLDLLASTASTSSSSASSSSSSSSASSRSGASTPDLREADVRNYDECPPSPAHLWFASRSQAASFSFSQAAASSLVAPSVSSAYRAPLSTLMPLPQSIDDLSFANLLDRQVKEHAKAGIRNMLRAAAEGVEESLRAQWKELQQFVPEGLLPYCTSAHARVVLPMASTLVFAQLMFRSLRFRHWAARGARLGFDASVLAAALIAAITAYRELNTHAQSPSRVRSSDASVAPPRASSPSAQLPSYAFYRRAHALSPASNPSSLRSMCHSILLLTRWLRLRYSASGPLRTSTLVLAAWMMWLARNVAAVQAAKQIGLRISLQIADKGKILALEGKQQIVERVNRIMERNT